MSVDINWEILTEGPDGAALAETIRQFVHDKFQQIALPKLIRSVKVHTFEFGKIAPQIVLKDICDPLPDFYENDDGSSPGDDGNTDGAVPGKVTDRTHARHVESRRQSEFSFLDHPSNPALPRGGTSGLLHGTSNLGYFHLPLAAGLSGAATPLAAVAGARFPNAQGGQSGESHHHHSESFSSLSPPSTATPPTRPMSQDNSYFDQRHTSAVSDDPEQETPSANPDHDRSPEDLQVVFHVSYSGDVKLGMTADVFLDYPMPSFVGIPLKLTITGLTFDGVGILAYIKKKAHLCFLAPEDAEALVGGEGILDPSESSGATAKAHRVGGLIEDIKIESVMGQAENGKQVLKNVGKIEKFILEQVRRIFEDEFVYPSFWTFLEEHMDGTKNAKVTHILSFLSGAYAAVQHSRLWRRDYRTPAAVKAGCRVTLGCTPHKLAVSPESNIVKVVNGLSPPAAAVRWPVMPAEFRADRSIDLWLYTLAERSESSGLRK